MVDQVFIQGSVMGEGTADNHDSRLWNVRILLLGLENGWQEQEREQFLA